MKVIIIPGYGDRRDYIDSAARHWSKRYKLEPDIFVFNWSDDPSTYPAKWSKLENIIQSSEKLALVGISAGASVALRALQDFPGKVSSVVSICGPARLEDLNPITVKTKYPLLGRSLSEVSIKRLPAQKILTLRPLFDKTVSPASVVIDGATNIRMFTAGHGYSIVWALFARNRSITKFINAQS